MTRRRRITGGAPPAAGRATAARPGRGRGARGRRLPRPDPADAEPHGAAAAAGELARCGVPDERITLLCATGTHRQATAAEMEELVGPEIVARYTIVDHDAQRMPAPMSRSVRSTATPVLLQREYVEADLRIITGFVEPHFFAGFSGGPKAVCPGLAADATILEAHHPRRIADARATFVTRTGNPVHDFVRAADRAGATPPVARRRHQPGPPGDGGVRRPAARGARCRLRPRAVLGHARGRRCPSISSCRPTAATPSTATCTRPSRAWPRPNGLCARAGSS